MDAQKLIHHKKIIHQENMKIIFTDHAKFKFKIFEQHGLKISESQISDIVRNPVNTNQGKKGRLHSGSI